MTKIFSNFSAKTRQSGIFGRKFKDFYFCTNIWNKANLRPLISNITMVFQSFCPKRENKAILVPNLKILIFALNFRIRYLRVLI